MITIMKKMYPILILLIFHVPITPIFAQSDWELKKKEDGIEVYVKDIPNSPVLAYKITTVINSPLKVVYDQVIDFRENKKYIETIKKLDILEKNPEKQIIVYMLYDMPWPFSDRDLVNKMTVDVQENSIIMQSRPANHLVKPANNVVRLNDFHEKWELEKISEHKTRLFLQGHANPEINFPGWIINIFAVSEPYSLIKGIKTEAEKNIPY